MKQPQNDDADHPLAGYRSPNVVVDMTWLDKFLRDAIQRNGAALAEMQQDRDAQRQGGWQTGSSKTERPSRSPARPPLHPARFPAQAAEHDATPSQPITAPAPSPAEGETSMTASTAERPSDKLTIAEVCADLDISRRTFDEWRAKGRAPRCIRLPNGGLRIRRCRVPAVARRARGTRLMDDATSYDVRIYKTVVYKGTRVTTYYVRWQVTASGVKEPFRTVAQADSFRSELTAARKGEAFSTKTRAAGLLAAGEPEEREEPGLSWYEFVALTPQ